MPKHPTLSRSTRKPLASAAPKIVEAAAAAVAAANAADAIVAPPLDESPASAPVPDAAPAPAVQAGAIEPAPVPDAGATEPAVAVTPAVTPLAAGEEVAAEVAEPVVSLASVAPPPPAPLFARGAMAATVPPIQAALAQAGAAYLHAWLDCQREAAHFLDRQLEYGRRAQRRLSECDDAADAARVQRDWSAEALQACLDQAVTLPAFAAKFWTVGWSRLATPAKAAAGATPGP